MSQSYLSIIDKLLVKSRAVVRESARYFKVYLPIEYNEIWSKLHKERKRVDVIIFLPHSISYVDKIIALNRLIVSENNRYRLYLPKRYNDIWEKLYKEKKKVDLLVIFK